jgi:hypothetical protein
LIPLEATMPETDDDAAVLRQIWDREYLGGYEGKWIAFRKSYQLLQLPVSEDLGQLLSRFSHEIAAGNGPIFAFVTFSETFI